MKLGVNKRLKGKKLYAEVWKPVITDEEDYTGLYEVSNLGRVRSLDRWINNSYDSKQFIKGKIKKGSVDKNSGYTIIILHKDGKSKTYRIHRLVAFAFVKGYFEGACVDHIIPISNGGTNKASNLRWVTYAENNNNELTKENMSRGQKGRKMPEKWVEKQINRRKGAEWQREENPAFKSWIVIIYPNSEVSDKLTRLEASKILGMGRTTINRLLKTKEVYKVKHPNGKHLKHLEGIRVLEYEDYLREVEANVS